MRVALVVVALGLGWGVGGWYQGMRLGVVQHVRPVATHHVGTKSPVRGVGALVARDADDIQNQSSAGVYLRHSDIGVPPVGSVSESSSEPHPFVCPPKSDFRDLQIPLHHLPRKVPTSVREKYNRRAHNCGGNGIWAHVTREDHAKILDRIVELAAIRRVSKVFDWGTGCGEKMDYLAQKLSVTGLGIDVSDLTIEYAIANTSKRIHYCVADGTKLDWIPSNYFDHSISFGSVYHVYNRTTFCHVLRQMVRITAAGGTVYNGWTENAEFKREHVNLCLGDLPVELQTLEEGKWFSHVPTFPRKGHNTVPNTYSLVLKKLRVTTQREFASLPLRCDLHVCKKVVG